MKWLHRAFPPLALVALLAGVLLLRSAGVPRLAEQVAALAAGPDALSLPPEREAEGLRAARRLVGPSRAQALLELVVAGSQRAAGELELWLDRDYRPNTLGPARRAQLEAFAWTSPAAAARRAAASLVLADAAHRVGQPPLPDPAAVLADEAARTLSWELGLRGLSDSAPEGAATWLRDELLQGPSAARRAAAALASVAYGAPGRAALAARLLQPPALEPTEVEALTLALRRTALVAPGSQAELVPAAIRALGPADRSPARQQVARRYLAEQAGRDLGPEPAAWGDWWAATLARLRRLGG